jgi:hypothetical protein
MLLRMLERRLRGYRAMGYTKGEAQPGTTSDELVIEYDEEVLRAFEAADEFA